MKEARGRQGEEKHGGRRERESKASNERRSRHKVNRYGPCSSQGSTALRTPRRLYFLSSSHPFLPSLYQRPSHRLWLSLMLAMRIEHHSFQTKVCRRGSALFLHSSIPETPDSFSLLNHAFLREREGERSVEVYFFLFYLSSIFLLSIFLLSSLLFERILFDIRRCCVVLFWEGVWNCESGIAGGRKPPNCGIQNGKALVSGQSRLKLVECVTRNRNTWH